MSFCCFFKIVIFREIVDLILSSLGREELVLEIQQRLTLIRSNLNEQKIEIEKFEILKVNFFF